MSRAPSVAFLWHLHQPDYRDPVGGDMALPWVRLHATRGYTDLGWVLERHPGVRATVNLTPTLVDQLDALVRGRCTDRFLMLSRRRASELSLGDRIEVLRGFFLADWEQDVEPLDRYWELLHKRGRDLRGVDLEKVAESFTDGEFRDLQVLFNLAWMGFAARQEEDVVKNLLRKARDFTEIDKEVLLDCQERVVARVLPRWRRLADRGQVELTTTPWHHPILPLLIDTDAARDAMPEASLPPRSARADDARRQLSRALDAHEKWFGRRPEGVWPAEGSLSQATLELLAEAGVRWTATDAALLETADRDGAPADPYRPWRAATEAGGIVTFFRDRILSDRIGFAYAANPAEDAVSDLLSRLRELEGEVVPIILDGENPWEQYPNGGRDFLTQMHAALEGADDLRTVTLGEAAERATGTLSGLRAGSWIEGDFHVWIGHPETNLAWQLVSEAGHMFDVRGADLAESNREEARSHLFAAEGSDWFWWYGDDFVCETPEVFDALFRSHLAKVYELVGERTPPRLRLPISEAAVGAVRSAPLRDPIRPVTPQVDGVAAPYVDWYGAGLYRPAPARGNMYLGSLDAVALYFGADITELFLRIDLSDEARRGGSVDHLRIDLIDADREIAIETELVRGCRPLRTVEGEEAGRVCFEEIVEVALSLEALGLSRGQPVGLAVHLRSSGLEMERLPRYGHVSVRLPAGLPGGGVRA